MPTRSTPVWRMDASTPLRSAAAGVDAAGVDAAGVDDAGASLLPVVIAGSRLR